MRLSFGHSLPSTHYSMEFPKPEIQVFIKILFMEVIHAKFCFKLIRLLNTHAWERFRWSALCKYLLFKIGIFRKSADFSADFVPKGVIIYYNFSKWIKR